MDYDRWAAEHAARWVESESARREEWIAGWAARDDEGRVATVRGQTQALRELAKLLLTSELRVPTWCRQEIALEGGRGCVCALPAGHVGEHRYQLTLQEMRFVVGGSEPKTVTAANEKRAPCPMCVAERAQAPGIESRLDELERAIMDLKRIANPPLLVGDRCVARNVDGERCHMQQGHQFAHQVACAGGIRNW